MICLLKNRLDYKTKSAFQRMKMCAWTTFPDPIKNHDERRFFMDYDKLKRKIEKACSEEAVSVSKIFCIPEHSITKEIEQAEEYWSVF